MSKGEWKKYSVLRGMLEPNWKRYGMKNATLKRYNELLKAQDGVCALCSKPPNGRRLSFDHNHKTGQIRGLLCTSCNYNLGILEKWLEERKWLDKCKTYLYSDRPVIDELDKPPLSRPVVMERRIEIATKAFDRCANSSASARQVIEELSKEEGYSVTTIRRYMKEIDPDTYRRICRA